MKSVALLVGINKYDAKGNDLDNPNNDVDAMEAALTDLGFDVTSLKNCTMAEFGSAVGTFQNKCKKYEVGLFYFSGHGFQCKGENYLCLKDTQVGPVEVMTNTSKKLEDIFDGMPESLKVKIFILDACRNKVKGIKGLSGNLCPVYAPQGSIVAFATSPNDYSYEGDDPNGCSKYTECLLKHIKTRGISIEECFKKVRTTLFHESKQQQLSWEHTSLIGDYSFNTNPLVPKGLLPVYGQAALADGTFTPDGSQAGIVINDLRSHNWYTQNDAIDKFKTLVPKDVSPDSQFVLGRNLLQSACGGSNSAIEYFNSLGHNLMKWQTQDNENHILDGILFEMYFNRDGNIRNIGQVKTGMIDKVMALESDRRFSESFSFIHEQLQPYSSILFYIPGSEAAPVRYELVLSPYSDMFTEGYSLDDIKKDGVSVLEKSEFSSDYCRTWTELQSTILRQTAIPTSKLMLTTNVEDAMGKVIKVPYPLQVQTLEMLKDGIKE